MARLTPFLFLQLFCLFSTHAQVNGVVMDTGGEPLPFATVYVQGTTMGTTTNLQGEYFLDLDTGSYELIFQYVGFRQHLEKVTVAQKNIRLDVTLEKESIQLP
ncbi:MAG: carboxypeptidase-like regulatory domain-containing protein, partial [Saprospiraceae bacterium]